MTALAVHLRIGVRSTACPADRRVPPGGRVNPEQLTGDYTRVTCELYKKTPRYERAVSDAAVVLPLPAGTSRTPHVSAGRFLGPLIIVDQDLLAVVAMLSPAQTSRALHVFPGRLPGLLGIIDKPRPGHDRVAPWLIPRRLE